MDDAAMDSWKGLAWCTFQDGPQSHCSSYHFNDLFLKEHCLCMYSCRGVWIESSRQSVEAHELVQARIAMGVSRKTAWTRARTPSWCLCMRRCSVLPREKSRGGTIRPSQTPVSRVSCVCFCAWCQSVSVRTPALIRFSRFIIPLPPFAATLEDKLPRAYDQEATV